MTQIDPRAITADTWDAFMLEHGGDFLQSWGWFNFQQAIGRRVRLYRTSDKNDGRILGQFLCLTLPLPLRQCYLYVPRGPVIASSKASSVEVDWVTEMLRERAEEFSAAFARVELPSEAGSADVPSVADVRRRGFREGAAMQPVHTAINDLMMDEVAQLAAMHSKTRYNIRVAERHGVTVREALYDDPWLSQEIDRFWKLLSATAERDGFSTHSQEYYRTQIESLAPGRVGGALRTRLWFAEHEGEPIAAALVAEYGDTATYLHGASDHAKRQLMAPYLLHWSIMRAAKSAGCKKYDFWGVAPTEDVKHAWAGITRFKLGFGGKRISYTGAWELPVNRFWYTLYRCSRFLRRK
jgi:lipid II:glycine glycyltransferase (peptidoglycan interpeptide bridge formation enzyme)